MTLFRIQWMHRMTLQTATCQRSMTCQEWQGCPFGNQKQIEKQKNGWNGKDQKAQGRMLSPKVILSWSRDNCVLECRIFGEWNVGFLQVFSSMKAGQLAHDRMWNLNALKHFMRLDARMLDSCAWGRCDVLWPPHSIIVDMVVSHCRRVNDGVGLRPLCHHNIPGFMDVETTRSNTAPA